MSPLRLKMTSKKMMMTMKRKARGGEHSQARRVDHKIKIEDMVAVGMENEKIIKEVVSLSLNMRRMEQLLHALLRRIPAT
ncbi:hypothetical protein Y032_1488g3896 [Ancylostoma ceylanicum]|uniref:Uncharacterized protein n=1 Tax=Ancylostoma ceylanicum TaxID=53326 RepID=A0A016W639_9BILA|nr:hypothetical protein Y032_1488g3896 [Ancylostoma ceylanicum]